MSDKAETDAYRRLSSRDEQGLIREQHAAELQSLCARAAYEAEARGLTEWVLNKLLED